MQNDEKKKLVRKRASIKASLTVFTNFVNGVKNKEDISNQDIIQLRDRLVRITPLVDEFKDIQCEIEMLVDDDDLENQLDERTNFEDYYSNITALAKCILGKQAKDDDSDRESLHSLASHHTIRTSKSYNTSTKISGLKLPPIKVPEFDGNYFDWLEFRDIFESMVNDHPSLQPIQKYHYLRSSLHGNAAQVIRSIEFTANAYPIAWQTICDRYNNDKLLVHNHVKALFNLEPITKELSANIRQLIDTVSKHLRSLDQLKQKTENWDTLLIYMISSKLDIQTTREWEKFCSKIPGLPTLEKFKDFLNARANMLETFELKTIIKEPEKHSSNTHIRKTSSKSLIVNTLNYTCNFCKNNHTIYTCPDFLKLSIGERRDFVNKTKLCGNCLREGHYARRCKIGPCRKCKQWHNTLLHEDALLKTENNIDETSHQDVTTKVLNSVGTYTTLPQVILSTAIVHINDKNGKIHEARVLLDCGSQTSFITDSFCKKLGMETENTNLSIQGITNSIATTSKKCDIQIHSMHNDFRTNLTCYLLPKITGCLPSINIDPATIDIPKNVILADPNFNKTNQIDILLGADLFWHILEPRKINNGKNKPIIQETKFGWIISGQIGGRPKSNITTCNLNTTLNLHKLISSFWEVEEFSNSKHFSPEEIACEKHFLETTKRNSEGRFIVSLPLKENPECLGESRISAENRFLSLERKLQKNTILRDRYVQFIEEYEALGHMSKDITTTVETNSKLVEFYMPHHGVLKEESTTTKLRVVFDASAPSSNGLSLNNIQMVGPTIQDDLFAILLRFRKYEYVITADIAKMYRQVLVCPRQRQLQKIVWRSNPYEPLATYTLNTVTYGQAAASFLSIRCLFALADECKTIQPEISKIIRQGFYVDDLLTGTNDIKHAKTICKEITMILKEGGFDLRKWHTNAPEILQYLKDCDLDKSALEFTNDKVTKTLGLTWSCQSDKLLYKISLSGCKKNTKRTVLSLIARIFDPLGLLSPCTIIAKMFMQQLWIEQIGWEDSIPNHILVSWEKFKSELEQLNLLEIPRHVLNHNSIHIELHGFSDASCLAYGACVYLRSTDNTGAISVKLLCSKTKVAPIKPLTIPKLELCSALLLSRLVNKVISSIEINFVKCVLWSDSMITLAWIKTSPNLLKIFIANRIAEIQTLTNNFHWRHVSSEDNPADLTSRGLNPSYILDSKLWWNGPNWLQDDESSWPATDTHVVDLPELKSQVLLAAEVQDYFPFERFSNFSKMLRVTAYIIRFRRNCSKIRQDRQYGPLTIFELKRAETHLIKGVQIESFSTDLTCLIKTSAVDRNSKILSLCPFLDDQNVIRVGGRLKNSNYSFEKKHPVILSGNHMFTHLLFKYYHKVLLHGGPQLLLFTIRDRYWPTGGRNLARQITRNCLTCTRFNPRTIQPVMGELPQDRVTPSSPFTITGVDYAGPYLIKNKSGRGAKLIKAYVCVFICFATKAIHLELVSSFSSEAFIMALRRFIARRGNPDKIYSDNGTNFVGASKEISRNLATIQDQITSTCTQAGFEWHFLPPYSPHFGGLWEAGVKSFKHHLKRIVGNTHLLFEEFITILAQIEAILNSRPLCQLSLDPNDLSPLSPGHFLVGKPLIASPDVDVTSTNLNRLSRYQLMQQICQHFWKRWQQEYISELQKRTKWKQTQGQVLKEGTLVLLKDDNTSPCEWKMGRILKIHPGTDGVARVATIKTRHGNVKRNFAKICPLPID